MALWKEQVAPKKDAAIATSEPVANRVETPSEPSYSYDTPRRATPTREMKESVIGSDITIEGKIDGAGHIRIAGRFKGDVHVDGNLTIEPGAKLTGGIRANSVVVGGEVEGNIVEAGRVELLASGVLNGDLKAGSLTVAAGSRMRGRVEFGWEDKGAPRQSMVSENGSNSL
ncbi:MAG: polymer-forming cytoskeletal protein [Gemmatimonadaceae bacterium]